MAHYPLEEIHAAALAERIWFQGRTDLDAANLGYMLPDVCECLLALDAAHFHATEFYPGKKPYDVYRIRHRREKGGTLDPLYIKLWLAADAASGSAVLLISFHRER